MARASSSVMALSHAAVALSAACWAAAASVVDLVAGACRPARSGAEGSHRGIATVLSGDHQGGCDGQGQHAEQARR